MEKGCEGGVEKESKRISASYCVCSTQSGDCGSI